MKDAIAHHVSGIPRSGIRDFFEVVQSMGDVISLGIGEPDFVTPWRIREAAIYSLEQGHTGYTSNLGLPRLRRSIADYVGRHIGVDYDPAKEIIVTIGVSEAIDLALRALLNPGDEVLYHEPCYVSYAPGIVLAGGVAKVVPTFKEDAYALRADLLEEAIGPKTKVLMLNYPTNPTGGTLTKEQLERIAEVCVRRNLIVLTDEIYSELVYDGAEHVSIAAIPGMRERTIFLHGLSKAFAMTGWRIGFACGPECLIDAMMKIHQYTILCASTMGQEAAIEALDHGLPAMQKMRAEYERRRNYIVSGLNAIGLPCFKPRGAFYVFPDISSTGLTSREFSLRLLKEKKVAVVPGVAFGPCGEGSVRCAYATGLEEIKVALERIAEFTEEVRKSG